MTSPSEPYDVTVVGAGPAGLAAAAAASSAGARVALVDAGPQVGGQYWRRPADGSAVTAHLYHGWPRVEALRARLSAVDHLARHHVQTVVRDGDAWVLRCVVGADPSASTQTVSVRTSRLILTTGAYDRQLPFPGWTLPGVMTAGGTQALLKANGVPAGRRVVVAGTGPLLLPVAAGLLAAGVEVPAVVEAGDMRAWARHLLAVGSAVGKLAEGAGYARRLAAGRTRMLTRSVVVEALGDDEVTGVRIARLGSDGRVDLNSARTIACDTVAVGWGFTAQLDLAVQLGCDLGVGDDGGLVVDVSPHGLTSVPGLWAAGEVTGVGGADLAEVEGEIAGLAAGGVPVPTRLLRRRSRLARFAAAVHAVHPVPVQLLGSLQPDTIVCRCEEVSCGTVVDAVREWGATDPRTVKGLTRAGMGWCQGRVCGSAVAALTAATAGREVTVDDLSAAGRRPLAVPSPLSTLAEG